MTKKAGRKTNRSGHDRNRSTILGDISHLFAGRAVVALLRLFFLHPSRDFYQRELTTLTGERLFLIQSGLKRLVKAGIIGQASRGNRTYYRVDPSHPGYEHLKLLMLKTVGLGDSLRAQLFSLRDKVKLAFLYGSVARGEETETSDIDLLLIGDLTGRETAAALSPAKKLANREINPAVYSPDEFRRKYRQENPFIREILRSPKIFLMGDEDELKAIIGRRSS